MTTPRVRFSAGPPATSGDLIAARERDRLLRAELARVREAAAAWRNGLGGLLVAVVGFSVIRGRSDISTLETGWAFAAGALLLLALLCGTYAALNLVRATSGPVSATPIELAHHRATADRVEALASAAALRRGVIAAIVCGVFLLAAVGTTWYGPAGKPPALEIKTSDGAVLCGVSKQVDHGMIVVRTAAGEVRVNLADAITLRAVPDCPTN